MYKIIGADQKEYGPITADQLRQWISEGRVNGNTKVQTGGAGPWKSVSELPEFAAAVPIAAPPATMTPAPVAMAPAAPQTNQMAVWAMVTGILSVICCQVLGPVSIVLGLVAMSQIKGNPQQQGSGFAIAGIVLGIISLLLVIIGILVMISIPQALPNFQNIFNQ